VKLLIVTDDSLVAPDLRDLLAGQQVEHKLLTANDVNLLQKGGLAKAVSQFAPSQIINLATYGNLELAEIDTDAARHCDEINALVPAVLAEVCSHLNLPLLHHSSSFVFDGAKAHPYTEEDGANPVCRYGRSKWYGERAIRDALPQHVILRTDWVFSAERPAFFLKHIETCKQQQGKIEVMNHRFSPTPAADVARVLLAMARQVDCAVDVWGTYHYCAQQSVGQDVFVEHLLQEAGKYDEALATALNTLQITRTPVKLPYIANTVLNSQKIFEAFGIKQRSRTEAVSALLRQLYRMPAHSLVASGSEAEGIRPAPALFQQSVPQTSGGASQPDGVRKTRNGRRPSKKGEEQKE
jgi:dTDP-4-dehydrorhamnose reductase